MALTDRLRAATTATHRALEETPVARALASAGLTRAAYARLARQTWHLHAGIEPACALAATAWPPLATLVHPARDRAAVLVADLQLLSPCDTTPAHPAITSACRRVLDDATRRPWAVAGPLYVLEGSRLGSAVIVRALAGAWGVPAGPGLGLDYHLPPPAGWWKATVQALDTLPLSTAQADEACEAASAVMERLLELYGTLAPGGLTDAGVPTPSLSRRGA